MLLYVTKATNYLNFLTLLILILLVGLSYKKMKKRKRNLPLTCFIAPNILYRDQAPINYCCCDYRNIPVKMIPIFLKLFSLWIVEVEEKELKATSTEPLLDGRHGLCIHGWEIETHKLSILTSFNLQLSVSLSLSLSFLFFSFLVFLFFKLLNSEHKLNHFI